MDFTLNSPLNFSQYQVDNSHVLVPGHYVLALAFGHQGATLTPAASLTGMLANVLAATRFKLIPISIGSVQTAKEPLVFFMNATADGYLGVYDQTSFPEFGLNFISHMATKGMPVLNRYRPDGSLQTYDFAPFLPRLSIADRNSPSSALMSIDAKNSSITITLGLPSGSTVVLPTVSGKYLGHAHNKNLNLESRSQGGVHMTDILQLILSDSGRDYSRTFTESGQYSMTVTGTIRTIEGKALAIDQTMDFIVADFLVTPHYSTLPMMPLQAGESILPMVTLMPAIPAIVDVKITYAPNSANPTTTSFTGTANHSGVFVANNTMDFAASGVYRVDIQVSHEDSAGHYYAGSRSFGRTLYPQIDLSRESENI